MLLFRGCWTPQLITPDEAYKAIEKTYRPPIVKIPFVKHQEQPVKDENLPIRKKDVAKTVEIITPTDMIPGQPITLVIDKKGDVYTTKDTPEKAEVKVTKWKPKFISFKPTAGYSLVWKDKWFHCFSLDIMRIDKCFFGLDIGININSNKTNIFDDWLLGASAKYNFSTLGFGRIEVLKINAIVGHDFRSQKFYFGVGFKW